MHLHRHGRGLYIAVAFIIAEVMVKDSYQSAVGYSVRESEVRHSILHSIICIFAMLYFASNHLIAFETS